jgi:hypothetical protein
LLTAARYQRAFIDFFEDQLVTKKYNVEQVLEEFLLEGKEPLINGLISGRTFAISPSLNVANIA